MLYAVALFLLLSSSWSVCITGCRSAVMGRHSKLQLQVLSLYRQLLRVARSKPGASDYIQNEFHKNATIAKTEVMKIEQLIRRGERQLESLKKSTTAGVGIFQPVASVQKDKEAS
jgi:succinate dehydrogenase assembly factor 1